jgi:hypothetical protein
MPLNRPVDVVDQQLAAYNARDIEAFTATYSADACIYQMPHARLIFRGRQQIAEHYGTKTFKRDGLRAEILGRFAVGNKVIDHERAWGSPSGPVEVLVVYEVQENLIAAVWFYDPAGASGPAPTAAPT